MNENFRYCAIGSCIIAFAIYKSYGKKNKLIEISTIEEEKKEVKKKLPILKQSKQTNTEQQDQDFIHLKFYSTNEEKNIFENLCADDLVYDKKFISITEDMTVQHVLVEMVNSECKCGLIFGISGEFIGIYDCIDATRSIIKSNERDKLNIREMLRQCVVADPWTGMSEIISFLCAGVRCIALKKMDGSYNLISQAAIVRMVFNKYKTHLNENETVHDYYASFKKSLNELGLGKCIPKNCSINFSARQAFEQIIAYGITSLPICSDGKAYGVISVTDSLYAIENPDSLEMNVLSYVEKSRENFNISREVSNIVSCSLDDNLETVLSLMLHENIHHVYILKDLEPIGVVSFVDILKVIK